MTDRVSDIASRLSADCKRGQAVADYQREFQSDEMPRPIFPADTGQLLDQSVAAVVERLAQFRFGGNPAVGGTGSLT